MSKGHKGFIILWKGRQEEFWTDDLAIGQYKVKEIFCDRHKIPPRRRHEVSVFLCEKGGEPIVHSTAGL